MIVRPLILALLLIINHIKSIDINDIKSIVHILPVWVPLLLDDINYTSENFALQYAFDVVKFPLNSKSFEEAYITILPTFASTLIFIYPLAHNQVANFHTGNSQLTTKIIISWGVLSYALFFNALRLWRHNMLNANTSAKLIAHCLLIYGLPLKHLWSL